MSRMNRYFRFGAYDIVKISQIEKVGKIIVKLITMSSNGVFINDVASLCECCFQLPKSYFN